MFIGMDGCEKHTFEESLGILLVEGEELTATRVRTVCAIMYEEVSYRAARRILERVS
jgi:hypothetical protein